MLSWGKKVALSKGAKVRIPISHANKSFEKIFKKSCKCVAILAPRL